MTNKSEYTCAVCGQTFTKGWSDEEAAKEREETFPGFDESECDLVCDTCYKEMGFGND
jgi:hypothetical protein